MARGTWNKRKTHFHCNVILSHLLGFWCFRSRNKKGRWRYWWTVTISVFNWSHCNVFSSQLWMATKVRYVASVQHWPLAHEHWRWFMSMVPRVHDRVLLNTFGWCRRSYPGYSSSYFYHILFTPHNLLIVESPSPCRQLCSSLLCLERLCWPR